MEWFVFKNLQNIYCGFNVFLIPNVIILKNLVTVLRFCTKTEMVESV